MDLKTLFIKIDNELQDNGKNVKDCQPILAEYNSNDYNKYLTEDEMNKLLDEKTDYIRIAVENPDGYKPQYFDPYLLVWSKNNFSRIHSHPEKGCILKILKGSIKETRYSYPELKIIEETIVELGQTSYIHDTIALHKVKNADKTDFSVSLHIYSPKGYIINYFDEK